MIFSRLFDVKLLIYIAPLLLYRSFYYRRNGLSLSIKCFTFLTRLVGRNKIT